MVLRRKKADRSLLTDPTLRHVSSSAQPSQEFTALVYINTAVPTLHNLFFGIHHPVFDVFCVISFFHPDLCYRSVNLNVDDSHHRAPKNLSSVTSQASDGPRLEHFDHE